MQELDVEQRFAGLDADKKIPDYNFRHFRTHILLDDVRRTLDARGICAGELAPDFALPGVGAPSVRLSSLRGQPVLLHFGSYS